MARESLSEKLARIQREKGTDIGLILRPRLNKMPLPMQRYDDPFLPFGKAIIDATRDLICCVMFDLAAYMALGAAGMVALERTIAYASQDAMTVLDAPFLGSDFGQVMTEQGFNVDAITMGDEDEASSAVSGLFGHAVFLKSGFNEDELSPRWFDHAHGIYQSKTYRYPESLVLGGIEVDQLIRVVLHGDELVYAGRGENFVEQVRIAVETIRNERK